VEWKRVLLVRFGSLGDVILTLPVIEAVRRSGPGIRISIAVKESYASLFASGPVDRVFALSSSRRHRGPAGLRRYADEIRSESPDLVIDLHRSLRSRVLARMLGAPVIRGSLHHLARQALVRFKKPVLGYPGHIVDRYLVAAERGGFRAAGRVPILQIPDAVGRRVGELLDARSNGEDRRLVALAPGAGRETKRWAADRYTALGRRLAEEAAVDVAVTGSESEADLIRGISEKAGHPSVFAFVSSDLREQGALLSLATRVVTNDSGLMHLAVAVGTPVLALFGATTTELGFYPLGQRDRVLSLPLDCRPCGLHGRLRCPRGDLACLDGICADRVFALVCDDLRGGG